MENCGEKSVRSKKYRLRYLPLFYEYNSQHNNRIRIVGDIKLTLKSGILRTAKETSPETLCGSMSPSFLPSAPVTVTI